MCRDTKLLGNPGSDIFLVDPPVLNYFVANQIMCRATKLLGNLEGGGHIFLADPLVLTYLGADTNASYIPPDIHTQQLADLPTQVVCFGHPWHRYDTLALLSAVWTVYNCAVKSFCETLRFTLETAPERLVDILHKCSTPPVCIDHILNPYTVMSSISMHNFTPQGPITNLLY